MDWKEAVEVLAVRFDPGRPRDDLRRAYVDRCAEAHPDHARWRAIVIRKAQGLPSSQSPRAYPSVAAQAVNLASSLWDWATSGFKTVSDQEYARRRDICRPCPNFDAGPGRCRLCGCWTEYKLRMRTEACPDGRW